MNSATAPRAAHSLPFAYRASWRIAPLVTSKTNVFPSSVLTL
jgi:hypothetical protein